MIEQEVGSAFADSIASILDDKPDPHGAALRSSELLPASSKTTGRAPYPQSCEPRHHLPASMNGFPLLRLEFTAREFQDDSEGARADPARSESMKIELHLSAEEVAALARLGHEVGANTPDAAKTALRDWLISHGYLEQARLQGNEIGTS